MGVDCLRISVTDRCNLRCLYCDPSGGRDVTEREEALTTDQIKRAVRLFVQSGVRKVRVTGGEPLLKDNVARLIHELADIPGIEDLSLTTNGVLLETLAAELKAAGLQRLNVSVDSMDRQTYRRITGFDLLPIVTRGIQKAIRVGLNPVKINSVIVRGFNDADDQITALAKMSCQLPIAVRFIEYYPTNTHTKPAADYVPNRMVRTIIERAFGPLSIVAMAPGSGPARYYKIKDSAGAIGFISGRSSDFCGSCHRLRMTCYGKLMPCLYSARMYDLGRLIRGQAPGEHIRGFLNKVMSEKTRFTKSNSLKKDFCMCGIGG
jgi:cyclic pyranopterin phosphate synthase